MLNLKNCFVNMSLKNDVKCKALPAPLPHCIRRDRPLSRQYKLNYYLWSIKTSSVIVLAAQQTALKLK